MRAVEVAIARQVVHGGDLATNLLEVGAVPEDVLTRVIAEAFGLEPAPVGRLEAPPPNVLALVSLDVARRHSIFPLELRNRTLSVAIAEPLSEGVQSELGLALNVTLRQLAAPVVRVRQAIAEHLGGHADRRLVRLLAKLEGRPEPPPSTLPPPATSNVPSPRGGYRPISIPAPTFASGVSTQPPMDVEAEELETPSGNPLGGEVRSADVTFPPAPRLPHEMGGEGRASTKWLIGGARTSSPTADPAAPGRRGAPTDAGPRFVRTARDTVRDAVVSVAPMTTPSPSSSSPESSEPPPPPAQKLESGSRASTVGVRIDSPSRPPPLPPRPVRKRAPLDMASAEQSLEKAVKAGDVLDVFLAFASQFFEVTALFVVHGDLAEGRGGTGGSVDRDRVASIGIPLDLPSTFATVRTLGAPLVTKLSPKGLDADVMYAMGRGPSVRPRDVASRFREDEQSLAGVPVSEPSKVGAAVLERLAPDTLAGTDLASRSGAPGATLRDVAVIPIVVKKRCVALLYGDEGEADVSHEKLADLMAFALRAAGALERLALKRKLDKQRGNVAASAPLPAAATESRAARVPGAPPSDSSSVRPSPSGAKLTIPVGRPTMPVARPNAAKPAASPLPSAAKPVASPSPSAAKQTAPAAKAPAAKPSAPVASPAPPVVKPAATPPAPPVATKPVAAPDAAPPPAAKAPAVNPAVSPTPSAATPTPLTTKMAVPVAIPVATPTPPTTKLAVPVAPPVAPAPPPIPPPIPEDRGSALPPDRGSALPGDRSSGVPSQRASGVPSRRRASLIPMISQAPTITRQDGESSPGGAMLVTAMDASPTSPTTTTTGAAAALRRLLEGGPGRTEAFQWLLRNTAPARGVLMDGFPGPLRADWRKPVADIPIASDCGPVLEVLVALGGSALPVLAVRAASKDPESRFWATHVLGEIRSTESVTIVLERLFDAEEAVRTVARRSASALVAAGALGTPILEALDRILRSSSRSTSDRVRAVETLGQLRYGAMVPSLLSTLSDAEDAVSSAARNALVLLTRQDFGHDTRLWYEWWNANGRRHRVEWLIDALMHELPELRKAASDELKGLTKQYFGYYDDLPKKERERAQAQYRAWWEKEGRLQLG